MIPRLYIIESKERDNLVKIGATERSDDVHPYGPVHKRISDYQAGLSDSAIVHEAPGAKVFERYLHNLVRGSQKSVIIRLKESVLQPEEWFTLEPEVRRALVGAFAGDHPDRIEDVPIDQLPVFLSGVMSAVRWHASRSSDLALEQESTMERYLENLRAAQSTGLLQNVQDPVQLSETQWAVSMPADLQAYANAVRNSARCESEMAQSRRITEGRTIIAIIGLVLLIIAWLGSPVSGCIFAAIALSTLGAWPWFQPIAVPAVRRLLARMQTSASTASRRAATYEEESSETNDRSQEEGTS